MGWVVWQKRGQKEDDFQKGPQVPSSTSQMGFASQIQRSHSNCRARWTRNVTPTFLAKEIQFWFSSSQCRQQKIPTATQYLFPLALGLGMHLKEKKRTRPRFRSIFDSWDQGNRQKGYESTSNHLAGCWAPAKA